MPYTKRNKRKRDQIRWMESNKKRKMQMEDYYEENKENILVLAQDKYVQDSKLKKRLSKAYSKEQYQLDPLNKKEASKAQYQLNPHNKKEASKVYSKEQYEIYPQRKINESRKKYEKDPESKINYSKGKYVLAPPKPDIKQKYKDLIQSALYNDRKTKQNLKMHLRNLMFIRI